MGRPKSNAHIDPNATDLASIVARTMRVCTHCKGMKPKTTEFFRFRPSNGYFSAKCIWCECRLEKQAYHENRTEILARKQTANAADPRPAARRRRTHYVRNKDRINTRVADRVRRSPTLRLRAAMRARFNKAINGYKCGRSWQSLVGYTIGELRAHIEALLPPEWTWENYGAAWVVDHKLPVASFDLPRQIKECWALSNLQPLERIENYRKGARIIMEVSK